MVLKTKEENRTNAQDKPLRLRVELVHLFPLVVQKLSSLIITEFTKYKSNSGVEVRLTIFIKSNYKMIEFTPKIINLENKMMSHENNYLYNRSFNNRNYRLIFIP